MHRALVACGTPAWAPSGGRQGVLAGKEWGKDPLKGTSRHSDKAIVVELPFHFGSRLREPSGLMAYVMIAPP